MPSELTIEVATWAMRVEQMRAQVAGRNIATASLPNAMPQAVAFRTRLDSLRGALRASGDSADMAARSAMALPIDIVPAPGRALGGGVALDAEVADLSEAELRYRTLAESVSRQMSLMSLAAGGK